MFIITLLKTQVRDMHIAETQAFLESSVNHREPDNSTTFLIKPLNLWA